MNIDFELYRIFYVVAKNGNITRASEELNISQPAISKSIKNLEEQLGGTLFVRTKRGVILTNEGLEFFNYIKNAIEYINNAEHKFTELINLEVGYIKIGTTTTLTKEFLLPYLEYFHKSYPNIDIQIIVNSPSELINKLKNGLIDMIVSNLNDKKYDNDIKVIKCLEIEDIFITNKDFINKIDKDISVKDLNNYPLVLQLKGSNTRTFIDNFTKEYNTILKPNIELASHTLVVDFVKSGFGIGYATKEYISDDLMTDELYEVKIKENIPKRSIGILISNTTLPNFSTKKLIEIITKESL